MQLSNSRVRITTYIGWVNKEIGFGWTGVDSTISPEEWMAFQAYHGVNGAQHQTNFNNLVAQGYRMISLSVYGDPSNPLYAAVWIQRGGPAFIAVHGVDANGYQSFFN